MSDAKRAVVAARAAVATIPEGGLLWAGAAFSRRSALVVAWLEEVTDHWAALATRPEFQVVARRAKELCRAGLATEQPELIDVICGPRAAPPYYATIRKTGVRDPWLEPDKYVVCVQYEMGEARPLWAHYIPMAQEELAREAAAEKERGFG